MAVGDGLDNDCDGRVDEEVCYDFVGAYITRKHRYIFEKLYSILL